MTTAELLSWLLTYAVHSTLLLGGVALATRYLVQAHAVRDTLWKTALLGGLVTSSLQVGFQVEPLGGAHSLAVAPVAPLPAVTPIPALSAPAKEEKKAVETKKSQTVPVQATPSGSAPSVSAPSASPPPPSPPFPWQDSVVLFWGAGAALLLLHFFLVRLRLVLRLGRREPVPDGPLPALLDSLRRQAGIRRAVQLTTAEGLTSPVALGFSEICIPAVVLTDLDVEQQQSMLAHELAHLARFDPIWLTLTCLIEQLLFFQPLNRLARRRMQDAAEYLCDDWAVRRTGSGLSLAKCLVKVAEWVDTSPRAVPVSGMAEHRSQLVARIHRLIENRAMMTPLRYRWLLPLAGLILLATAALAPGFTTGRTASLDAQEPVRSRTPKTVTVAVPDVDPTPVVMTKATARALARANAILATQTTSLARLDIDIPTIALTHKGRSQDTTNAAVPALIAALGDPDANVRMAAASSLGRLEDPRAIPGLINATRDGNVKVRSAAYEALSDFDDPRILEPMMAALKDPDPDVRRQAAQSLGNLEDRRAVSPLIAALSDSSAEVRRAAAQSLGELQDPAAAGALAAALKDSKADVRRAAAQSLGELELTTAPPALIAALKDPDADVRRAAAQSLGEIQDPSAVAALKASLTDTNADVRESSVYALSEISDSAALNALIGALKSPDPEVRRKAAEALGQKQ